MAEQIDLVWKCHLPNLLSEIFENPGTGILVRPLQITARLLDQVAEAAARINDPELNALMCRLTLYTVADPESGDYDRRIIEQFYAEANEAKRKRELLTQVSPGHKPGEGGAS